MTRRLYQDDCYRISFEAEVAAVARQGKSHAIELDATCFYPEAGGQPCDTGEIGGVAVESVVEEAGTILHIARARPGFGPGERVSGRIDWQRRFLNMQQHTGQHILSQACLRALGAPTVSSRLGMESSTIDIGRLDLEWDDIRKAEHLANSVVYENREVYVSQERLEDAEGLRLKKQPDREIIRIVDVDGFDKSPCGGTHVRRTGEVGIVKVLRWEKVRDTTRLEFVCGELAEADYFWKNRFVVDLAQDLTTKDTNVPGIVADIRAREKALRKEIADTRAELLTFEAARLRAGGVRKGGLLIVAAYLAARTPEDMRALASRLTAEAGTVALLASGEDRVHLIFARSADVDLDLRRPMERACRLIDGKGGGRPEVCQGGGRRPEEAQKALDEALGEVERAAGDMHRRP